MNVRQSRQPLGFGHHAQVWREHLDQADRNAEAGPQSGAQAVEGKRSGHVTDAPWDPVRVERRLRGCA